jgi:ABC-type glycerol-3-phosphate transport system substrate-binding protein
VGIPEINSLNMGVSEGIATFDKFLLQTKGQYYNTKQTASLFNTSAAYNAFEKWVKLYRQYGLDREYNFYSRFRTGEMPMAIQNYSAYNLLVQAAPELQGLWAMAPIPGTKQDDGTIDRSESGNVAGCIMLNSAKTKGVDKETLKFLKWWVSAQTQTDYGNELEATLGVAARYSPANMNVMPKLGWSDDELAILKGQMTWVKPIPQVPGNYLIARSLTTSFRSAVTSQNNIQQALTICNKNINDEITRKRKEFNLN